MHCLLYEFITGGGWLFVEPQERPHGSLLAEGLAMISAVAEDFAALGDTYVTILWDARLALPAAFEQTANCRVVLIHSIGEHDEQLAKIAASADRTLLVAPEFDGHLSRVCQLVNSAAGRLVSPGPKVVELASDKHLTALTLARRAVAVPPGIAIEPGERLPNDFTYPAVLKPRDGAGSQCVVLIPKYPGDAFRAAAPMRLESFVAGNPISVAALCGPAGHVLLPPCSQRLSNDGRFTYLGGETPLPEQLAQRAQKLATQALTALPQSCGYIGIDLVLSDDDSPDVVIEVNPRLTTSYVGLRRIVRENLAEAMLQAVDGGLPDLSLRPGKVEFTADGAVSWVKN